VSGALAGAPQALAATTPPAHAALFAATGHPISAHLDAAVRPSATAFTTYTVQPGDTLAGIASRFYGRASAWHELYRRNRSKISNPNLIFPGQVLAIPRHLNTAHHPVGRHARRQRRAIGSQQGAGSQQSAQQASAQSPSSGANSASLSAAVQQDIASGNDLLAVAQYLVANGYSEAAAAGVASCVDGESGGDPESVGTGGGGLIGWTPIGSAAPNSDIITGNPEQDMMAQLADILYYNSTEIGQPLVDELNSQTDPVAAADFYSQNFEKPAVTDSDVVPSVAEQIFSALDG
jgi:LysM repeat protein